MKITQNNFIINRNFFISQKENNVKAYILTRMAHSIETYKKFPSMFEEINKVAYLKDILFDVKSVFTRSCSRQSLWRFCNQLEKEGFIVRAEKDGNKYYTLTSKSWDLYKGEIEEITPPELVAPKPTPKPEPTPTVSIPEKRKSSEPAPIAPQIEVEVKPEPEVELPVVPEPVVKKEAKPFVYVPKVVEGQEFDDDGDPLYSEYWLKIGTKKEHACQAIKRRKLLEESNKPMSTEDSLNCEDPEDDGEDEPDNSLESEMKKAQNSIGKPEQKPSKKLKNKKIKPYVEPRRDLKHIDDAVSLSW